MDFCCQRWTKDGMTVSNKMSPSFTTLFGEKLFKSCQIVTVVWVNLPYIVVGLFEDFGYLTRPPGCDKCVAQKCISYSQ